MWQIHTYRFDILDSDEFILIHWGYSWSKRYLYVNIIWLNMHFFDITATRQEKNWPNQGHGGWHVMQCAYVVTGSITLTSSLDKYSFISDTKRYIFKIALFWIKCNSQFNVTVHYDLWAKYIQLWRFYFIITIVTQIESLRKLTIYCGEIGVRIYGSHWQWLIMYYVICNIRMCMK